ncbi:O-antigen ligase family protein [Bradyrhizobium sp. LA2.1]|uniref:O-antigen ligase family protein n=1 Tax=Bradyrhizobium sp. LA2.1 TaxID=3156376 RepID=UPI00339659A0
MTSHQGEIGTFALMSQTRVSARILFLVVALAPLPFGSMDAWVEALWCIVLGVAAIAASPDRLRRHHVPIFFVLGIVVVAYAVVLHEQLAISPWFGASRPSPLWTRTSELLGVPLASTVSIARHQPIYALGAPFIVILTIICGIIVGSDRSLATQLLKVVAWSGATYAIFGLASFLIDPTRVLWVEKEAHLSYLTATFTNRNTAAVYFGSCSIVWLLFTSESIRTFAKHNELAWGQVFSRILSEAPRDVLLPFFMLSLCVTAMFMTGSRAGIVLSLAGLVLALLLYFYRDLPGRSGALIAFAISLSVVIALFQILGASVSGRFSAEGLSDAMRLDTYRSTVASIADHPWLGTGIGTFPSMFPAYRSLHGSMWGTWDRAHNTLLELASEGGLPLTMTIVAAWGLALAVLIRGIKVRRRDRIVPIAALAISAVALAHSLVDFSIQVPGFAITVFGLLGVGLSQSFSSGNRVQ